MLELVGKVTRFLEKNFFVKVISRLMGLGAQCYIIM